MSSTQEDEDVLPAIQMTDGDEYQVGIPADVLSGNPDSYI